MSLPASWLAVDLGAESGRAVLGRYDGERLVLEEVHRFLNEPVQLPDGLHWDILRIFHETIEGIGKGVRAANGGLQGVAIDSWAVDFGLLDRTGALVSNPYHYRDPRTEGMLERAFSRVPKETIYETTGIQFMAINTLYQLLAMHGTPALESATTLLLIPDLLNYWLTGERAAEYTNATTTQLLDLRTGDWARSMMGRLRIPTDLFPPIVQPGTHLGAVLPAITDDAGLPAITVSTVASHDTASAVVAVPAKDADFAYISSGTWSLVGIETAQPVVSAPAMAANLTNEGGFGGTIRLLKNVMGLWLLQECRRTWARQGNDYPYEEIARLAEAAPPFEALVDPDHPSFLAPGDMPARIRAYCAQTGQQPPKEPGAMARCVLESLALKYRLVLENLQLIAEHRVKVLHVVGGGVRNELLCRFTAGATGLPLLAGPAEATALGNVLVQAHAAGKVGGLGEMRALAQKSVTLQEYAPEGDWSAPWERFQKLVDHSPNTP